MSKYIIEIPDDVQYVLLNGQTDNKCYTAVRPVAELEVLNSDYINEHYGELQDEAYQRGLEDAWEAAQKVVCKTTVGDMSLDTLQEIFGVRSPAAAIMQSNTAQQAIDKIKAYEENKDEPIKAGDIVDRYIDGKFDSRGIYLGECDNYWRCLYTTGAALVTSAYPKEQFKKTGKHYDIASILEAMRTHD